MRNFHHNNCTPDSNINRIVVYEGHSTWQYCPRPSRIPTNTVVRSHSYFIQPTLSKISGNKPNSYPCQLNGTTQTSPTNETVSCLLTTLTITDPKSPPAFTSLFSFPNLPQDHPITLQLHQSSKPFS